MQPDIFGQGRGTLINSPGRLRINRRELVEAFIRDLISRSNIQAFVIKLFFFVAQGVLK
jgi:hypothetical protein